VKFMIHGNSVGNTGYGVQVRHLATLLSDAGHDVAISSTYGHQGNITKWKAPNGVEMPMYPAGYLTNGPDVICAHAQHFFGGDPTAGWLIMMVDVWPFVEHPMLKDFQVIAWVPVDHLPCPPDVLRFFANSGAIPVPMAKFGERMLIHGGLDPHHIPLSVDTSVFKPTFTVNIDGEDVPARKVFGIPDDAFCVGLVGMNKDPGDRKNFDVAFRAFGRFHMEHPDAVLFVHSDPRGMAGSALNLHEMAAHAAVPEHALIFTDEYAYRIGLPPAMMAGLYTCFDVLLAPSKGEGFCVPMIEAQACGVPVIASDFSAQSELIGPGWRVNGQLEWDQPMHASYITPFTSEIAQCLMEAYDADLEELGKQAIEFASRYDTMRVWEEFWVPFLAQLEPPPPVEREVMRKVSVIVPLMRPQNLDRLMTSIGRDKDVEIVVVHDGLSDHVAGYPITAVNTGEASTTYSEKINLGYEHATADWILVVGDDVEFTPGWLNAAIEASTTADVIGTYDSEEGRVRNPDVAAGRHADHFFIRRSYIDDEGSSLDGPGVVMPDAYRHWFVDREVIELAKARGVFKMCDARIIHHHPGYDGDEKAREADPTYMAAVDASNDDQKIWMQRAPLIEGHRVTRVLQR